MNRELDCSKFTAMRGRTDQRLFTVLLRELSAGNLRAEKACANALVLIPTMTGLSERQKSMLRQRVEEVRRRLQPNVTSAVA